MRGWLRVPRLEHEVDKQIAAIALVNDLTLVTRNGADSAAPGSAVGHALDHVGHGTPLDGRQSQVPALPRRQPGELQLGHRLRCAGGRGLIRSGQ